MSKAKTAAKVVGGLLGVGLLGLLGLAGYVQMSANKALTSTYETHRVEFPIPAPLTPAEIEALKAEKLAEWQAANAEAIAKPPIDPATKQPMPPTPPEDLLAGVDLDALARERAIARGKHLVESRFVCVECHGANFGGGKMLDDPMIGSLLGRNLTLGKGGVTAEYTPTDWDRMVRHGVKRDGTPGVMPSDDYWAMSDQELADVISYIRAQPPVDNDVPPPVFGPVGKVLLATGMFRTFASKYDGHQNAHAPLPPAETDTVEFGKHISVPCTGCHRPDFSGGPIIGAPPDWPPAANLSAVLKGYTLEQFADTMRSGKRPDGSVLKAPMDGMPKFMANVTETEMSAMFTFLQGVEQKPDNH